MRVHGTITFLEDWSILRKSLVYTEMRITKSTFTHPYWISIKVKVYINNTIFIDSTNAVRISANNAS